MNTLNELKKILHQVGPENIWRSVYDIEGKLLSTGIENDDHILHSDLNGIDFTGKTVVDLGCNFGHFTFWVSNRGAHHVLGIDIDPRIIRGCQLLKKMYDYKSVDFVAHDFININELAQVDLAMLINFIGKTMVQNGEMISYLKAVERIASNEMLISIRPVYQIKKHLENDLPGLLDLYPARFIKKNCFNALEYVESYFQDRWHSTILSPINNFDDSHKKILHFHRKSSENTD